MNKKGFIPLGIAKCVGATAGGRGTFSDISSFASPLGLR